MLKFLRRYNRYILVIGGSLLMVAFLVPSAFKEFERAAANKTVMRIDGRKVSAKQYQDSQREYNAIDRLPFAMFIKRMCALNEGSEQWLLLTEMAKRNGYIGGVNEGRALLPDLEQEVGRQVAIAQLTQQFGSADTAAQIINNPQYAESMGHLSQAVQYVKTTIEDSLPRVLNETRMSEDEFDITLAKLRGVMRLQAAYLRAGKVSGPRAMLEARKKLERASIDYIFIPPDRVIADVGEPDAAALQAQLDRFKAMKPGEGDLGIGYLLPPRIKLEWIGINRQALEAKLQPDLVAVHRAFELANKGAAKPEKFEDAKDRLTTQLRNESVQKVLREVDRTIKEAVNKATAKLPAEGQFRVLPPDWNAKRPDFEQLKDQIVKNVKDKTGVTIDPPAVTVKNDDWLTASDLSALPGIGQASLERGQRRDQFAAYALSVHELAPLSQMALQVGIPSPETVKDSLGNIYYFTVLDSRTESAPRSVDDAKDMLTRDWKKIQAFEILKRDAEGFKQQALAQGLDSLDPKKDDPVEPGKPKPPGAVKKNVNVMRERVSPADADVDFDTFRNTVIDAAMMLDPLVPSDTVDVAHRTFATPVPKKQGVVVAQVKTYWPLTVESYQQMESQMVSTYQGDEIRSGASNPFSLERLKARMHVEMTDKGLKEQSEEG